MHVVLAPPFTPGHVQVVTGFAVVGKTGAEGVDVPTVHFVSVPKDAEPAGYVFSAEPQVPFIILGALQAVDVVPPFNPAQVQFQGPVPETEEAVPTEHKLAVGAAGTPTPLAVPQTPLTLKVAVQVVSVPLLIPLQVQVAVGLAVVGNNTERVEPALHFV